MEEDGKAQVREVTLNFDGKVGTIISNEEGMYDLNYIWRTWELREEDRPSEWNNAIKDYFLNPEISGIRTTRGRYGSTYGTQQVLYAYAMWIDVRFYSAIVEAFTLLVNGEIEAAKDMAASITTSAFVSLRKEQREWFHTLKPVIINSSGMGRFRANLRELKFYQLVCLSTFGITPAEFERQNGMRPRDWIEINESECDAIVYERKIKEGIRMLSQGSSWSALQMALMPIR